MAERAHRVLIIGATGMFGTRLSRHLAATSDFHLMLASRSEGKAKRLGDGLLRSKVSATLEPVGLDASDHLPGRLSNLRSDLVIDCSGPFQGMGFDTARAVLNTGAAFIDLADARDYLAAFPAALNDLATANNVVAVAGASSTPALSGCVVDRLTAGWQRVDDIDLAISPGGRSEVGQAVVEAIMSYVGKPVPAWKDGRLGTMTGWVDTWSMDMPGLGKRRVAAVETFDAERLGERHGVTGNVRFGAGLESSVEQFGVETMARVRSRGLFFDPTSLAPLFVRARKVTRITTGDSGGMVVVARGLDASGEPATKRWSLLAENDHGPYTPVMAAAAAARKILRSDVADGAHIGADVLELAEIEAEMEPYAIRTKIENL